MKLKSNFISWRGTYGYSKYKLIGIVWFLFESLKKGESFNASKYIPKLI